MIVNAIHGNHSFHPSLHVWRNLDHILHQSIVVQRGSLIPPLTKQHAFTFLCESLRLLPVFLWVFPFNAGSERCIFFGLHDDS